LNVLTTTLACVVVAVAVAASLTYATTQQRQVRLNSDPELDGLTPFERNAPLFKKIFRPTQFNFGGR